MQCLFTHVVSIGTASTFALRQQDRKSRRGVDCNMYFRIWNLHWKYLDNAHELFREGTFGFLSKTNFFPNFAHTRATKMNSMVLFYPQKCFANYFESVGTKGSHHLIARVVDVKRERQTQKIVKFLKSESAGTSRYFKKITPGKIL